MKISASSLLGGAHLCGVGSLKKYLTSNGKVNVKDGNGVPISHYIREFTGFDMQTICKN